MSYLDPAAILHWMQLKQEIDSTSNALQSSCDKFYQHKYLDSVKISRPAPLILEKAVKDPINNFVQDTVHSEICCTDYCATLAKAVPPAIEESEFEEASSSLLRDLEDYSLSYAHHTKALSNVIAFLQASQLPENSTDEAVKPLMKFLAIDSSTLNDLALQRARLSRDWSYRAITAAATRLNHMPNTAEPILDLVDWCDRIGILMGQFEESCLDEEPKKPSQAPSANILKTYKAQVQALEELVAEEGTDGQKSDMEFLVSSCRDLIFWQDQLEQLMESTYKTASDLSLSR